MLVVTALAIIRMDKLFAVVMLSGVFSFLSALLFIVMDAVDVAFTEAAVGAGITTVLMLGTIALTARTQKKSPKFQLMPVLIIIIIGVALIYGTMDMPNFGDLKVSFTSAIPTVTSLISGSREPSIISFTASSRS